MLNIPAGLSDEERGIYKVCFTACEKLINEGKTIAEAVDAAIAKYSFLVSDVNELRRFLCCYINDARHSIPHEKRERRRGFLNINVPKLIIGR